MKGNIKWILFLGAAVVLTYCSSISYLPTHQNIVDAQERWPEADSIYLYRGYETYMNKCSGCHYLYNPNQYSVAEWEKILPEMSHKAKLSETEIKPLRAYLLALSRRDSTALD